MGGTPVPGIYGKREITGFRFGDTRAPAPVITHCNAIPHESLEKLPRLHLLVIAALRAKTDPRRSQPPPTHLHVERSLAYIAELNPRRALLTHIGHDISHDEASRRMPENVELAYDGLQIEI